MSLSDVILRPKSSFNLTVSTTGTTGTTLPDPAGCTRMRLASTADVYVFISSNGTAKTPVADGSGMLIRPSTGGELFRVAAGDIISCIAATSATGILNVTYMTA